MKKSANLTLAFFLFTVFFFSSNFSLAESQAPPRNYLDLGPHYLVTLGFSSIAEYRDSLLDKNAVLNVAGTATYRGISISGYTSSNFTESPASELSLTYSHKIPYFDAHFGVSQIDLNSGIDKSCSNARLGLSTHSTELIKADLIYDTSFNGDCHLTSLGLSHEIWADSNNLLDIRFSRTNSQIDSYDNNGWSLRLIGSRKLNSNKSIHYYLGYIETKGEINKSTKTIVTDSSIIGLNYVWEFR